MRHGGEPCRESLDSILCDREHLGGQKKEPCQHTHIEGRSEYTCLEIDERAGILWQFANFVAADVEDLDRGHLAKLSRHRVERQGGIDSKAGGRRATHDSRKSRQQIHPHVEILEAVTKPGKVRR